MKNSMVYTNLKWTVLASVRLFLQVHTIQLHHPPPPSKFREKKLFSNILMCYKQCNLLLYIWYYLSCTTCSMHDHQLGLVHANGLGHSTQVGWRFAFHKPTKTLIITFLFPNAWKLLMLIPLCVGVCVCVLCMFVFDVWLYWNKIDMISRQHQLIQTLLDATLKRSMGYYSNYTSHSLLLIYLGFLTDLHSPPCLDGFSNQAQILCIWKTRLTHQTSHLAWMSYENKMSCVILMYELRMPHMLHTKWC